jgi:hypothetical protein
VRRSHIGTGNDRHVLKIKRFVSDTAFRIFVLRASRRLNSDRFFTADFTEDQEIAAVNDNLGLWQGAMGIKVVRLPTY